MACAYVHPMYIQPFARGSLPARFDTWSRWSLMQEESFLKVLGEIEWETDFCRVWALVRGQSAPCNIIARLSVCLSVRSINAWVSNSSLNGGSTWRPVRSFSSGHGRPLPASWVQFSSQVYALALRSAGLWSPTLCRVVWIFSIVRSSWRVKCVEFSTFHKLEALRSLHHVHVHPGVCSFAGSLPQCRLVSILDRADWSCDSNSVRQIKPFCLKPSEAPPGESSLF